MRKWVVTMGLVFTIGCASSGQFTAITFSNLLKMNEDAGMIREWEDFETSTMQPYMQPLVDAVKRRNHQVFTVDNLAHLLVTQGLLTIAELDGGTLWGYNDGEGTILIDSSLSLDETFATLLHELGHSLQPEELEDDGDRQVYAESFAYLVCLRLGLDTRGATFPYMQGFHRRHDIIQRYAERLDAQVEEILAELR